MRLTIGLRTGTLAPAPTRSIAMEGPQIRPPKRPIPAPVWLAVSRMRLGGWIGVIRQAHHQLGRSCATNAGTVPGASEGGPQAPRTRLRSGRFALGCTSMAAIGVLLAVVSPVMGQQKTLIVAGYGGSFEQTMRKEILPGFEAKHGPQIEYVVGN